MCARATSRFDSFPLLRATHLISIGGRTIYEQSGRRGLHELKVLPIPPPRKDELDQFHTEKSDITKDLHL